MAIGDDFEIQINGDIRHTSGSSTYTVLELHRWLQDLADNTSSIGDDNMDITYPNPSERATDNIIMLTNDYNIDDTVAQYLYGGSIYQLDGTSMYSGLQVLGSVSSAATKLEIIQNNTKLTNYWGTGINDGGSVLLRMLVKTRASNADIDGKRIRVQAREWGDTYDFFEVTLGDSESVAAISTFADIQNDSDATSAAAFGVTNTEGYQTIDLNNGNGAKPYYSKWNVHDSTGDLKEMWEYGKYITVRDTSQTIHGINGELFLGITFSYGFNTETGSAFVEDDVCAWGSGTTAGTGLLLALDSAGYKAYMQLLTGINPTDGMTVTNEATTGTHDLNGAPNSHTVPGVFLGSYTGALISAFGVGVDEFDLSSSDSIEDLNGTAQSPPITVDFRLTGLQSDSEVRIYKTSDSSELDGIESSSTLFTYNYTYSEDTVVFVVVFHVNYKPIRLIGLTLTSSNQNIPIQQIIDRVYNNPE